MGIAKETYDEQQQRRVYHPREYPVYRSTGDRRMIIFGDSFAELGSVEDDVYQWDLARRMGCDTLIDYARGGSSVWYTCSQVMDYLDTDYRPTDVILCILTSPYRLPVVEDWSEPGNAATLISCVRGDIPVVNGRRITTTDKHAYSWLIENFATDYNCYVQAKFLYKTLESIEAQSLVVQAFRYRKQIVPNQTTFLYNLCIAETGGDYNQMYDDKRTNHFNEYNHKILAEKLFLCYINNDIQHLDRHGWDLKKEYSDVEI